MVHTVNGKIGCCYIKDKPAEQCDNDGRNMVCYCFSYMLEGAGGGGCECAMCCCCPCLKIHRLHLNPLNLFDGKNKSIV